MEDNELDLLYDIENDGIIEYFEYFINPLYAKSYDY